MCVPAVVLDCDLELRKGQVDPNGSVSDPNTVLLDGRETASAQQFRDAHLGVAVTGLDPFEPRFQNCPHHGAATTASRLELTEYPLDLTHGHEAAAICFVDQSLDAPRFKDCSQIAERAGNGSHWDPINPRGVQPPGHETPVDHNPFEANASPRRNRDLETLAAKSVEVPEGGGGTE